MTTDTTTHPCPSVLCDEDIPRDKFACRRHWHSLPTDLRKRLSHAWRNIRNDPGRYFAIRDEAIDYLNGDL